MISKLFRNGQEDKDADRREKQWNKMSSKQKKKLSMNVFSFI